MGPDAETAKLNLPLLVAILHSPEDRARAVGTPAGLAPMRKDLKTAEALYLEVFAFWTAASELPSDQSDIAVVLNNLGLLALRQGRTTLARERLEQSLTLWRRIEGPASVNMVKAMTNLALVCMRASEYERAATWLEQGMPIGRNSLADPHPSTVAMTFAYAEAKRKSGRKSEAKVITHAAAEARKEDGASPV
jgi:hypothetical protein